MANEYLVKLQKGRKNLNVLLTDYIKEYLILFGTKDFKRLVNGILDDMNIKRIKITEGT